MKPDEATCRWLVSDDGRGWLARAVAIAGSLVQRAAALRRDLAAERTAAVLEQLELRERARAKFLAADQLFFDRLCLEQATDDLIADYKARRFLSFGRIADLCCGIGGDLMALAEHHAATGVERDPAVATFASANLAALDRQGRVSVEEVSAERLDGDAWHIDPDRRPGGRRSVHIENHEPGPAVIEQLLARCPHGAIKLAPAAEVPDAWSARAELEWVSRGGECKQQVVWFGDLAKDANQVRATLLARRLETPSDQAVLASLVGRPGLTVSYVQQVGRYLFEPDAAVLAADLAGTLAAQYELAAVTPGIAYLTSDRPIHDAALTCFDVLEVMPYRPARIKAWLDERRIGQLEIKKRGVAEDPAVVRKKLGATGDNAATLILMPIQRSVTAILARRVTVE